MDANSAYNTYVRSQIRPNKDRKVFKKEQHVQKKRYALIGTGSRARMFIDALITTYRDVADLVALSDLSQTRMNWYNRHLETQAGLAPVPTYLADQFDRMIAE